MNNFKQFDQFQEKVRNCYQILAKTCQILAEYLHVSQCPLAGFEKKNVSKVCRIQIQSKTLQSS